jgi:peptidoglycan/LPS O-acetylase OafA/YrhL
VKTAYRGDIDGLRALAVICVVGFHAFPKYVAGGFVGVDVFFVISGFLISAIICKDLEQGNFAFLRFYSRRIKRIFPALIVVLAACMCSAWLLMFPDEFRELGKAVAAGAGFGSNLALLQEGGYFDTAASLQPLRHLWSLGVEEQFYIIWPAVLVLTWRWRKAPLAVAGLILVSSFLANLVLTTTNPIAAFYLPVTRFWELMLGAVPAIAASTGTIAPFATLTGTPLEGWYRRHRRAAQETAACCGIGLIIAAVFMIGNDKAFPGWWALMPGIGTVMLLLAGEGTAVSRFMLGRRAFRHIGLISYPFYLWHWPILCFAYLVHYRDPSPLLRIACIGVALILAELTYRFIEKPIRFGAATQLKPLGASVALATIGGLGLLIYADDGVPMRFPSEAQIVVRDFRAETLAALHEKCLPSARTDLTSFTSDCGPPDHADSGLVLLWGDSDAAHLVLGLKRLEDAGHSFHLVPRTSSGCPPVFGFVSENRRDCGTFNQAVELEIGRRRPHTVIMAGRWDLYDGSGGWGRVDEDAIRVTVGRLKAMGVNRVVGLGQFPVWQVPVPKIRARSYRLLAIGPAGARPSDRNKTFLNPSMFGVDETIAHAYLTAGADFVSPLSTFCTDDEGCLLVVPNGQPVAFDQNHLTEAGSFFFVELNAAKLVGEPPHMGEDGVGYPSTNAPSTNYPSANYPSTNSWRR